MGTAALEPPPRSPLEALLDDLRAEQADLDAVVAGVDLELPTPAEGWTVRDTLSHLAGTDEQAVLAATDPDAFTAGLVEASRDVEAFLTAQLDVRRGLGREEHLAAWRAGFAVLLGALAAVPEGTRVPWYGPPMSPLSFATARLMEYWAHGVDVADAAGVRRAPTARLRHVCHLGVRTRSFAYANRGLVAPEGDVRVELAAPDGSTWSWGSGDDAVRGPALDFCLLVTQRRHRDDLALTTTGPLADGWLDVAQCFAGPPGPGRPREEDRP